NRQKAVETIKRAEHIKAERRPGILMAHDLSLPGRLDTGAHIGPLVHVHETVRAIAGNAQESAWAMILEAAREDPHSRGMEGGRDTLPRQGGNRSSIECERPFALRICQPADERACGFVHGTSPSSQAVRKTSLVRTSRTATSQRRQPKRWYQRSCCGPGKLPPAGPLAEVSAPRT